MIVNCECGATFWAEPPLTSCPRCDEPKLVRFRDEPVAEFTERASRYYRTLAEIRALPEASPRP
jgi:hypothetical protein